MKTIILKSGAKIEVENKQASHIVDSFRNDKDALKMMYYTTNSNGEHDMLIVFSEIAAIT